MCCEVTPKRYGCLSTHPDGKGSLWIPCSPLAVLEGPLQGASRQGGERTSPLILTGPLLPPDLSKSWPQQSWAPAQKAAVSHTQRVRFGPYNWTLELKETPEASISLLQHANVKQNPEGGCICQGGEEETQHHIYSFQSNIWHLEELVNVNVSS